jgi:hypothetical protein
MELSRRAKTLLLVAVGVAVAAWIVLLDLGLNAGRVHYGVSVVDLDVGGLTEEEARSALAQRGRELKSTPVVFTTEGLHCPFVPEKIGWRARPIETAERARAVGFNGGPLSALADRARAWFGGVEVEWAGSPQHWKVTALIDRCERQAEGLGLELERFRFRKKIGRSIVVWPRRFFGIPVAGG